MMANVMDHLKCPICYEIPEGKVFQCKNGHTFCALCSSKLRVCPNCRVVLGCDRIRNRILENILDSTKFACPNKELGCCRVLDRKEIGSHLLFCKFEPFYFCKLIGFQTCSFNAAAPGKSSNLLAHLVHCHPQIQETTVSRTCPWVSLNYKSFLSRASNLEKNAVAIWTPQLLKVEHGNNHGKGSETVFILLCQVSELTNNAAWICLRLTTDKALEENNHDVIGDERKARQIIHYRVSGEGKQKGGLDERDLDLLTPKMTWKAPVLTFTDIDKELNEYALRVPISILNCFANSQGGLGISIKLEKTKAPGFQDDGKIVSTISELSSFVTSSQMNYLASSQRSHDNFDENQACPAETNHQVIFENVFCNGCGLQPLVHLRYKCLQCEDFDLCKTCMERGDTHMHHVFARVHNTQQTQLLIQGQRRKSKHRLSYIY